MITAVCAPKSVMHFCPYVPIPTSVCVCGSFKFLIEQMILYVYMPRTVDEPACASVRPDPTRVYDPDRTDLT